MLFVVAGRTSEGHCLSSMLDFDAICCDRRYFCKSLFAFDASFCCIYVVFQSTWLFYCLPSMLGFDAICGVPEHLVILLFAFDA